MDNISPVNVFKEVSDAIPAEYHSDIIIVGSLAAGYHFFGKNENLPVRTKDIDCVIYPQIKAAHSGKNIAQKLLDLGWRPWLEGEHAVPGNASTPDDKLPAVRFNPPHSKEWFIELLTVPENEDDAGKHWLRVKLSLGHYGLCSFRFLSLVMYKPIRSEFGIYYARPEMMALANLLEHPEISPERMSGLFEGREIKRSNKDLGRVLAIAYLMGDENMDSWSIIWLEALKIYFPKQWQQLTGLADRGLRSLLDSEDDLEEAVHTCNVGLLSARPVTTTQLRAIGKRLLQDVITPLEEIIS